MGSRVPVTLGASRARALDVMGGSADQSHLTRAFVRDLRTTPGRYRTERRKRPMD